MVKAAISHVLTKYEQLDGDRTALVGDGLGGLLALNLALGAKSKSGAALRLILKNPVTDLTSLAKYSDAPDLAWQLIQADTISLGGYRQHIDAWIDRQEVF